MCFLFCQPLSSSVQSGLTTNCTLITEDSFQDLRTQKVLSRNSFTLFHFFVLLELLNNLIRYIKIIQQSPWGGMLEVVRESTAFNNPPSLLPTTTGNLEKQCKKLSVGTVAIFYAFQKDQILKNIKQRCKKSLFN